MTSYEHFAEAAHAYADLVAQIRPDQWDSPGLGVWDLRALVGHGARALITVDTYLDRPAAEVVLDGPVAYLTSVGASGNSAGGDPGAVAERGRQAGASLGADPAAAVRVLVERVLPRVERAGDPVIETIGGGMRLSDYLPTRTFELVVHGLDVARASGQPPSALGEEVLDEVTVLAASAAVRHGGGAVLLAALTGRAPLPEDFSVV
ncbi:maleylpyruvate isomerase N-terminal domain-containing protein [uncultured Friedmanniella sp.]|uniref:maleylpyruvate isomerase N-terminal domain-containing protein n=1 Tax=uncultured Friedmanniella sp. TaxID=335381 RepID=UPI0035CA6EDC